MAESNPTQVILTDDGLKIIKAQNTANEAVGNVNDINSDNKLTPSEKLKLKQEYDKDVELYNIDIEQLKSVDLPTTELETAMSNLTDFVTPLFKEMNRTSTVDRDALDSVFTAFATADKNASQAFVNMVQQVADDAKKAGDDAKEAGEKAQEAGEAAKQAADQAQTDATQAKADAATAQQKAQSSIDQLNEATTKFDGEITDAKNSAKQALDNIEVVDSKVTKLSTSTTAQFNTLNNGYQEVISTVNNMDIGGRNIVLDSSNMGSFRIWQADGNSKLSDDKKEITITTSHGGINIEKKNLSEYLPNKGDTIVISADVKGNSHLQFNYNDGNSFVGSGTSIVVTTEYKRYSTTFEWNPVNLDAAELVIYAAGSAGQYLTIKNVKVEIGNKATDWSPAPEDLASQTQITALNNLISQKVSNDQYQSDKTQTANLISQTVTNAVSNISVGGTNLIKNSNSDVVIDDTVSKQGWKYLSMYSNLETGQQYTFSSEVTVNVGKADKICVNTYNPNDGSTTLVSDRPIVNGKIEYTFTAVKDFPVLLVYAGTMGGTQGNKITFHHYQLENGNKATDWSPAPEDLATSTEIDQINNAIKLKANSSDVTSQITVATKGIQSDVTNKVSDLNTKISQTSDAVQILNTTSGLRNLVYNSSYTNNAEGWNMFNQTGYLSTLAVSSYNGSPGFGVSVSGKGASTWTQFGESKRYTLPQPDAVATENTYSGSAMIKMYDDSDSAAHLSATLTYYDKNGARIVWKDMIVFYDSKNVWTEVKFENLPVPKGAYSIGVQYWAYGSKVHGMIAQPMIVFGPKIGPYNPDAVSQSDITASINNINLKVSNSDGSSSQVNINNNTILLDANKIIFNGNTSIQNGTIGTAKIANAAINTAQIADGAINNAKIANAAINDAKISNLNGNKIVAGSITANKINVDDLIANGINTKTLTSVNLNTSTLITPKLDLGLNGTFTESFDYTQPTTMFLPKKNKGNLTFNHGVLQSEGNMQTYVNGQWGGMNDNLVFQSGINNAQWTEVAPGYIKLDLYKQNGTDIAQRTYSDPTGFYYTSATGDKSYLGNVLQTGQVQSGSILGKYIGPMDGELRLQIGNNGDHYGLQVGSYAGSEAVMSDFIYSFTSSNSSNVRIADTGRLMRTTSASKYKYNIKNPDIEETLGDRLLNVRMATWNDKHAVDSYAEELSTGEKREKVSIDKYYGLIAEQLRDAGLDMFVDYGKNHEIEGIQYDRAWIPLLSVVRRLNDKVNEYELRLSKLEEVSK
ncbi:hypothetical protein ACIPCB_01165 [Pediococcus pentosaceus]|uniref:hypothetical protein n=1 Tax=Pediococcus pentosaceus TaxID=1255 RepID=UPI001912514A|nr:hypothetical protein [Pediococcus pentosaceus]MCV3324982.1 hypothetical protein [Pediococcus pentosaceus]